MLKSVLGAFSLSAVFLLSALPAQETDRGFAGTIPNTVVFGGTSDDHADSVFVDSAGSISVVGHSESWEFLGIPKPFTSSVYRFLARFRPDGTMQSVNTIPDNAPYAIDSSGNLYVLTNGLTKFSPDGVTTLFNLPIPGYPQAITVDGAGRAYVVLEPLDYISNTDYEVARVSASGDRIEEQVRFPADSIASIALDPAGAVYIAGTTGSSLPTTPGVLRQSCPFDKGTCGFVVKIPASMARVEYCTLLGGTATHIWSVAADGDGNAYIAGDYITGPGIPGNDIPLSAYEGPPLRRLVTEVTAAFIAKLDPSASALVWAHGLGEGSARAVMLEPDGSAVIAAGLYLTPSISMGLWRVNPQGAAPTVLTQFPGRPWDALPGGTSTPVRIAVDPAGPRFVAAAVAGGFPRKDLGLEQDAILVKVPANPPTADLAVTIDAPQLEEGRYDSSVPYNMVDSGRGRYVARVDVKNNGPDPAGPLWLQLPIFNATEVQLEGQAARDGKGGFFRARRIDPGETLRVVLKFACDWSPCEAQYMANVVSMTADPTVADQTAMLAVQTGSSGPVLKVTSDHNSWPLDYFRSDVTGPLNTSMDSPSTNESVVSVWFPPVQYSQGTAWIFQGWSDGSTDPVKTITATGGTVELVAKVVPRREIEANPQVVYFVSLGGSAPLPKRLSISPLTNARVSIATADAWLSAARSDSGVTIGPWDVSVNVAGMAPGEYHSSLQVSQEGTASTTTVPVILRVLAEAPQITAEGVVDAASYQPCDVGTCHFVAIFAPGIGPDEPVSADAVWNTQEAGSVGGIDVCDLRYDGADAKVLYAGPNQLNVALFGHWSAAKCPSYSPSLGPPQLALMVDGQIIASVPFSPPTTGSPIFTLDMSGVGNAVALNADGSVNWAGNPARPGTMVHLFFAAGDSLLIPYPSLDFDVMPGYDLLDGRPPVITIGGVEADIANIGAPEQGLPGVRQVDVFIPEDAPTGPAIPVAAKLVLGQPFGVVTEYPSQTGITLAIQAGAASASPSPSRPMIAPVPAMLRTAAPSGRRPPTAASRESRVPSGRPRSPVGPLVE